MKFKLREYIFLFATCFFPFQVFASMKHKVGNIKIFSNELISPTITLARQVDDLHSLRQVDDLHSSRQVNDLHSSRQVDDLRNDKSGFYLQHRHVLATYNTHSMPKLLSLGLNFDFSGGWNYNLDYYTKIAVEVGLYNRFFASALHTGLSTDFLKGLDKSELNVFSKRIIENFKNFGSNKSSFVRELEMIDRDNSSEVNFLIFVKKKYSAYNEEDFSEEVNKLLSYKDPSEELLNQFLIFKDAPQDIQKSQVNVQSIGKELFDVFVDFVPQIKGLIISNIFDLSSAHRIVVSGIYSKSSHKIPELSFYTGIGAGYGTAIRYLEVYSSSNAESYPELFKLWGSVFRKHYKKAFYHDVIGVLKFGVNYKLNENWSVSMECENTIDAIFKTHNGSSFLNLKFDFNKQTKLVAGLQYEF